MSARTIAAYSYAALLVCAAAHAQDAYPVKPVRLVVPAVGGGSDIVARIMAPKLSEAWGH